MSRPGVAYDPIPDSQESSDIQEAPYDPPSETNAPEPPSDDLNPDEQSVTLVRPRFLGSTDAEGVRESLASYGSRAQSEALSSLYALNPESLSTRGSPVPGSGYFAGHYHDDPHDNAFEGHSVPLSELSSQPRFLAEKQAAYASYSSKSRRNTIILSVLGGLILLIVAVVLPVYFLAIKHTNKNAATQQSDTTAASPSKTSSPSSPKSALITGGDGSTVTMDDGTTFTYQNSFGGYWYYNPNDPFNNAARPQSWSPALNETFQFGSDRIRGYVTCSDISIPLRKLSLRDMSSVNLGGWLVTEPVSFYLIMPVRAGPSHSSIVHKSCSLPKISKYG